VISSLTGTFNRLVKIHVLEGIGSDKDRASVLMVLPPTSECFEVVIK
jgi:hypothetical protein